MSAWLFPFSRRKSRSVCQRYQNIQFLFANDGI